MDTPWWATGAFWAGIGIASVIGLAMNILANLSHSKIVAFLDSRKITSHEKRRKKALQLNDIITDLHDGRRDKYIYILRMLLSGFGAMTFSITTTVGMLIILALAPKVPHFTSVEELKVPIMALFLMSSAFYTLYLGYYTLRRIRFIANTLDRYEEYKAAFAQRWSS